MRTPTSTPSKRAAAPPILKAYGGLSIVAAPLTGLLFDYRARRGKEDRARRGERFGLAGQARPQGGLIWVHAASVGETNAVLPLITRILALYPALHVLLTTTTVTSAKLAAQRLPPRAIHQFVPIDMRPHVRRFLAHWRPDVTLFAESELWPNLLTEAKASGARLVLVNGRMSARSFARWKGMPRTITYLLSSFDQCLAQSEADAARIIALGAPSVITTGNLKFDTPDLLADPTEVRTFAFRIGARPVWAAASTHAGEEEMIFEAHLDLARRYPNLLTILAPRHPERADAIAALAERNHLAIERRSQRPLPSPNASVYLVDTIGELGLVYRACPIVFMGGSLIRHGGQNPIEPARLDATILHGPHVANFSEVYAALDSAGGAEEVRGAIPLAQAIERLIDNPRKREMRAEAAHRALVPFTGALDRSLAAIKPLLDRAAHRS